MCSVIPVFLRRRGPAALALLLLAATASADRAASPPGTSTGPTLEMRSPRGRPLLSLAIKRADVGDVASEGVARPVSFRLSEEEVLSLCGWRGACVLVHDGKILPTAVELDDGDGAAPDVVEYRAWLDVAAATTGIVALELDPAAGFAGLDAVVNPTTGIGFETTGDVVQTTLDNDDVATVTAGELGGPVTLTWILSQAKELELCATAGGCEIVENMSQALATARTEPDGRVHLSAAVELEPGEVALYTLASVAAPSEPPVAVGEFVFTAEDTPLAVAVLANDSDPDGDPLSVVDLPVRPFLGTAEIQFDGTVLYTPAPDKSGFDRFQYTITDGFGGFATAQVSVITSAVNDPPRVGDDLASTLEETAVVVPVLANDSDPEFDALTVIAVGPSASGTPQLQPDQTVLFVPGADFFGTASFTYTVSDGVETTTGTVTVEVGNVPDPPVAVDDQAATEAGVPVTIPVLLNDRDPDGVNAAGGALTVSAAVAVLHGTASPTPDGTAVVFSPDPGFAGAASFAYRVRNASGLEDEAAVAVTVTAGDAPPVAVDDQATVAEDAVVDIDVLANDEDPEGAPLTVVLVGPAASGTPPILVGPVASGTPSILADGRTVRFTPEPDAFGTARFLYTISDGAATASATVTVEVLPRPDFPVAVDDLAAALAGTEVVIPVLANDRDPDGGTLTVTALTLPGAGTARIVGGAAVAYTPVAVFVGEDLFTYTVTSSGGESATAQVRLTVDAVNRPPVAGDDEVATDAGAAVEVAVLLDDTDPEGTPLAVSAVGAPAHGVAELLAGGVVRYTPDPGFAGVDSFDYAVSDGELEASATVTVTVSAPPPSPPPSPNRPPVALDDLATALEDGSVVVPVLANDEDPELDALSVVLVGPAASGTPQIQPDQTVLYTPNADFFGTDTFTYTVSDGELEATATVTVEVAPLPDFPRPADDSATATSGVEVVVPVTANDVDPDGGVLTVTSVSAPGAGSVRIVAVGSVGYRSLAGFTGEDTFFYTVVNGSGEASSARVTVAVEPQQ